MFTAAIAVVFCFAAETATAQEPLLEAVFYEVLTPHLPPQSPSPANVVPMTKLELINSIFTREVVARYWIEDYKSIDGLKKELVDVPHDSEPLGIRLRTWGRFPIAQMESSPKMKPKLFKLRVEAAGALYLVANRFQNRTRATLESDEDELPPCAGTPLDLTSLVRTWLYQKKLMKINANADVKAQGLPPTHVLGLAFDIGRATLTKCQDQILWQILAELESEGTLIYFKEGAHQAAYHVIALPAATAELRRTYLDIRGKAEQTATSSSQFQR